MKRIFSWMAMLLMVGVLFCSAPAVFAEQPSVCASSAVLMEAQNGRVLFAKNAEERHSMASTTKIMTALIAVQSERLNDVRT